MNDSFSNRAVCLPAPALRPFISHYAGFRAKGLPPSTHAGLPSRHVDLIISLARPIEVIRMPSGQQGPAAFAAFVSGLQDAPASVRQFGDFDGIHCFLKPHGVRAILGVPSPELTSLVVHLSEIWGRAAAGELIERLMNARSWQQRFFLLDRAFLRALKPVGPPRALVWAWRRLVPQHLTDRAHPHLMVCTIIPDQREGLGIEHCDDFFFLGGICKGRGVLKRLRHLLRCPLAQGYVQVSCSAWSFPSF